MSETTEIPAPAAANGAGAVPLPEAASAGQASLGERLMFAVMLMAGAGLLFLAVDGLTGYALSRLLRGNEDEGG